MPHRNQEIVALCRECKVAAATSCVRCGAPLCAEHAPADDDLRCGRCEAHYTENSEWLQKIAEGKLEGDIGRFTVGFLIGTFALPTLVSVSVLLTLAGGWLGGVLGAGLFATGAYASRHWYRRTPPRQLSAGRMLRKRRKKFMKKRAQKALPPGSG